MDAIQVNDIQPPLAVDVGNPSTEDSSSDPDSANNSSLVNSARTDETPPIMDGNATKLSLRRDHRPMDTNQTKKNNGKMTKAERLLVIEEHGTGAFVGLLFILSSILSYVIDVITDCTTARAHYLKENYDYFKFTLGLIISPGLAMSIWSWFRLNHFQSSSRTEKVLLWIFHWTLPISLVFRKMKIFLRSINNGNRIKKLKAFYNFKNDEEWNQLTENALLIDEDDLSEIAELCAEVKRFSSICQSHLLSNDVSEDERWTQLVHLVRDIDERERSFATCFPLTEWEMKFASLCHAYIREKEGDLRKDKRWDRLVEEARKMDDHKLLITQEAMRDLFAFSCHCYILEKKDKAEELGGCNESFCQRFLNIVRCRKSWEDVVCEDKKRFLKEDENWNELVRMADDDENKKNREASSKLEQFAKRCREYIRKKNKEKKTLMRQTFKMYNRLLKENYDGIYLHLMESFMEAAPQLTLQFYIMAKNTSCYSNNGHIASIIFSGISLAWALTTLFRAHRRDILSQRELYWRSSSSPRVDDEINFWKWTTSHFLPADCYIFLGHFLIIFSRISALALFASTQGYEVFFIVCFVHWILMVSLTIVRFWWNRRQRDQIMNEAPLDDKVVKRPFSWSSIFKWLIDILPLSFVRIFISLELDPDDKLSWPWIVETIVFGLESIGVTVLWGFSGAHLSLENDFAGRLITVLGFGNVIVFFMGFAILYSHHGVYPSPFKNYLKGVKLAGMNNGMNSTTDIANQSDNQPMSRGMKILKGQFSSLPRHHQRY